MNSLPFKLTPGSDLRLTIEEIGRNENKSGFVLGVVGNLSKACFQCPGRSKPTVLEGNLEIITLNGTFSPEEVHLHLSLSDSDCNVWGGHLEIGTKVLKGADLLLGFTEESKLNNHSANDLNSNNIPHVYIAIIQGCPWSARALRLLKSNQIPYEVEIIDNDEDFLNLKMRSGLSTFPQIFIDGELLGGYESLSEFCSSSQFKNLR